MNPAVAAAWPFLALLIVVAVVLVLLHERAMRHDDDEITEAAERARCGMPARHPDRITRALAPADEFVLAALAEDLNRKATE